MKRLNMGEWSLIARYLKKETRNGDLNHIDTLVGNHPDLREEMTILGREINTSRSESNVGFDAQQAFKRLNERLVHENLI